MADVKEKKWAARENGDSPLITVADVTLRQRDRHLLAGTHWQIRRRQHWAVVGPNGCGKTTLMRALTGEVAVVAGRIIRHDPAMAAHLCGYVSFELQRRVIAGEMALDDARWFSGQIDHCKTVAQVLDKAALNRTGGIAAEIVFMLQLAPLMTRSLRHLSNGEMRRLLIARAMAAGPRLLILDEPYDGLDAAGRQSLAGIIGKLMQRPRTVILATHRAGEIPAGITHLLTMADDRITYAGPYDPAVCDRLRHRPLEIEPAPAVSPADLEPRSRQQELIAMRDVTVRYGDTVVVDRLTWKMHSGQNWAILGPNGIGKTTLLRLIAADHLQAYANRIRLFGIPRGSGESIWQIKQKIGWVSPELQIQYGRSITAFEVVLSGFFDSIGLYQYATQSQKATARRWLDRMDIGHLAHRRFDCLSGGEQRMVLIVRGMVKTPQLLIMDEPCQGLDPSNRAQVLALIELVGRSRHTDLLYVTHHLEEMPTCLSHILHLQRDTRGRWQAVVEACRPQLEAI